MAGKLRMADLSHSEVSDSEVSDSEWSDSKGSDSKRSINMASPLASRGAHNTSNLFASGDPPPKIVIFVIFQGSLYKKYGIAIRQTDTVNDIKKLLFQKTSISPSEQELVYAGKALNNDRSLEYYNILASATLHCMTKLPDAGLSEAQSTLSPSSAAFGSLSSRLFRQPVGGYDGLQGDGLYLSKNETKERMLYWRDRSIEGCFDADTYIVDPIVHYSHLEYTEERLVINSEYFQCRGNYRGEDNRLPDITGNWISNISQALQGMLPAEFAKSQNVMNIVSNQQQLQKERWKFECLWKNYIILCRTMWSFERLKATGFCTTFYSMLVERRPGTDTNKAELVRIDSASLHGLKTGIENAITHIFRRHPDGTELVLMMFVATQCDFILKSMGLCPENQVPIMDICRVTVLLLDLALVSYAGSHGSRFTSYIESNDDTIEIQSENKDIPTFGCTLRKLACLSDFLDNNKVWVFYSSKEHQSPRRLRNSEGLAVLTRMEELADIWGPAWATGNQAHPDEILQYKLLRGFIRPVPDTSSSHGVIRCHWYSTPLMQSGGQDDLSMRADDLLLIGAGLVANNECRYTLNHYESDFGMSMGFLGTISESWSWDTQTLAIGAGQYLIATVSGTKKKIPAVTLKENIWNKLALDPQNSNIEFMNNFVGVEISHCSGNARRIRLKDIFRFRRVRDRLTQNHNGWEQTEWGRQFSAALEDDDFETIRRLWIHQRDLRPEIGQFIAQMLQLLHITGLKGNSIIAAYFSEHEDRNLEINITGNEWGRCLRDSLLMASYAVVADTCLKYPKRSLMTATCPRKADETILETRIVFENEAPSEADHIRLQPAGDLFRVERIRRNRITIVPMDGQRAMRMLHPTTKVATEIVSKIGSRENAKEFLALVKASTVSYSGMQERRQMVVDRQIPLPTILTTQQQRQVRPPHRDTSPQINTSSPPRRNVENEHARRQRRKKNQKNRSSQKGSNCCFL